MLHNSTYNPDILTCLANLSNDEVFTPPSVVNQMLDMLPAELFRSSTTTFLDPVSKSGVFLREIAKRLMAGLAEEIPDKQERANHIFTRQLFGLSITELTALISRRSVYCSKRADGRYSLCTDFKDNQGNIRYRPMEHTFMGGKCRYCGAAENVFGKNVRGDLESHAYEFIHTDNPEKLFPKMKFDVIIGNPPYHLNDGGQAASDAAMPIYQRFIEKAILMQPRFLTMIIPAKWMVGGRGLNNFRKRMMDDVHLKYIYDFENSFDCFPGVHIDGGVCYFLRDSHHIGLISYVYKPSNGNEISSERKLKSSISDIVIRDIRRFGIIEKATVNETFTAIVSARKPFGIGTDLFNNPSAYKNLKLREIEYENSVKVYGVYGVKGGAKRVEGHILRSEINKNEDWINKYKILVPKAYSTDAIIPPKFIKANPGSICTETFLVVGPFDSERERDICFDFMQTNFFRILLYWGRGTMQVSQDVFRFIPKIDFSHPWTDAMLYEKYGLSEDEIAFIESMIRPME